MVLFSEAAAEFWMRWFHIFFGILWIGHLFYFNFSQMGFMAETDAPTKSQVMQKLAPKTMFWFRWGAMFTFLFGVGILSNRYAHGMPMNSTWSTIILTGAILGTLMFLNVWLVIWPNNKIMIENAIKVAKGDQPVPGIAELAARASVASRTNTLFTIPMLFFMIAASHLPLVLSPDKSLVPYWSTYAIVVGLLEINAVKGKMGPLQKLGSTIHFGLLLTFALYFAMEFLAG
jgi:uncharacterized membrane protein